VSNYRPLTSVLCKTLEHITSSHIYDHLNKHKILCQEQHGFKQHRSCETQLVMTVNDLAETLSREAQMDVILLDRSKAFDTVPQFIRKLISYGITGDISQWIASFHKNRFQLMVS